MTYFIEQLSPEEVNLRTPLRDPIPAGCAACPFADRIVRDQYDQRLMTCIDMWMRNLPISGESGLISRNDGLMGIIFDLAGLTYAMRDRHDHSTNTGSRSDVTMGYAGCALVLVEEKDTLGIEKAKEDLRSKFQWITQFGTLPYVISLAITRHEIEIFAMTVNGSETVMRTLFHSSITRATDKWSCVIASINIARVLRYFIDNRLFIQIPLNVNEWITRPNGKTVKMGLGYVGVKYEDESEFYRLKAFYELAKNVPHLEKATKISTKEKKFHLVPLGIESKPNDVQDLRLALVHILKCITELHRLGYCHCDIRWSNIIKADEQWYLIDCTLATRLDDVERLTAMPSTIKSVFVFDMNPWSPRHDFYQIGLLLSNLAITAVAPPFQALCEYLLDRTVAEVDTVTLNTLMETLADL